MDVTSGIRQGCLGSTTLFKLIMYKIIQKLEELDKGYKDEIFKITSLFFADDGMLLATSIKEAEEVIDVTLRISKDYGLEINKNKSKIIIFNMKDKPERIRDIEVSDKLKYLGILINDSKKCFRIQKEEMIKKARKLANVTYSVVGRCCSKILIGKTFWKSIVLPTVLYGTSVIDMTKKEIEELQRVENGVYRQILGAAGYTQAAALRGEIGAKSMKARLLEGQ